MLVDETYVEFAEEPDEVTAIPLTEYYNNIVILRGISKFFAAPGLRLGYAICGNRDLLNEINQKRILGRLTHWLQSPEKSCFRMRIISKTRELISSERARICARLDESPNFKVYHAHANFVLVKITTDKFTSEDAFDACIRKNLMIRDCSTFPFLNNKYIRLCFMMPEQNDALLDVLLGL